MNAPNVCDWRGLDDDTNRPRYEAIVSLIPSSCSVLDVGCGEGVLSDYLPHANRLKYTGIEPVEEAAIKGRRQRGVKIISATAEQFAGSDKYDFIVFNEMLYYCSNPVKVLTKFSGMLAPGGRMIISIYLRPENIGLKHRFLHLLQPKKPLSNKHCLNIVLNAALAHEWKIVARELVPDPVPRLNWYVLAIQPQAIPA